jgi:hypothetical protein
MDERQSLRILCIDCDRSGGSDAGKDICLSMQKYNRWIITYEYTHSASAALKIISDSCSVSHDDSDSNKDSSSSTTTSSTSSNFSSNSDDSDNNTINTNNDSSNNSSPRSGHRFDLVLINTNIGKDTFPLVARFRAANNTSIADGGSGALIGLIFTEQLTPDVQEAASREGVDFLWPRPIHSSVEMLPLVSNLYCVMFCCVGFYFTVIFGLFYIGVRFFWVLNP